MFFCKPPSDILTDAEYWADGAFACGRVVLPPFSGCPCSVVNKAQRLRLNLIAGLDALSLSSLSHLEAYLVYT